MAYELNGVEKSNLAFFSTDHAVNVAYNNYGLNDVEQYIVSRYFTKSKARILDIGCGRGRTTVPLDQAGFNVTGIDISKKLVYAAASSYQDLDFRVMNACELGFDNETFDYVFFSFNGIDCIYPEDNRIIALQEIYRVLAPGGLFIFSSHNSWWLPLGRKPIDLPYFLAVLTCNIHNLRMFRKYRVETTRSGSIIQYYQNPQRQKKQLNELGFEVLETVGPFSRLLKLCEPYLHYVVRRMAL